MNILKLNYRLILDLRGPLVGLLAFFFILVLSKITLHIHNYCRSIIQPENRKSEDLPGIIIEYIFCNDNLSLFNYL